MHSGLGFVTPEGPVTQILEAFLIVIHLGEKSEKKKRGKKKKKHKNEAFSTKKLSPHLGKPFSCVLGRKRKKKEEDPIVARWVRLRNS